MRGNSASVVQGVAAAKKLVTKAVFYVDNLSPTVSPEGLSEFVRKLLTFCPVLKLSHDADPMSPDQSSIAQISDCVLTLGLLIATDYWTPSCRRSR